MVAHDPFLGRAQLLHGGLAAGVAHVDHELHPDGAALEGVGQQEALGLRIGRAGAGLGADEGGADLDAPMQAADGQEAGGADADLVFLTDDQVAHPLAALALRLHLGPPLVEPLAAAVDRHDLPALGVAVEGRAQALAVVGSHRFEPDVGAFEGNELQVHDA